LYGVQFEALAGHGAEEEGQEFRKAHLQIGFT